MNIIQLIFFLQGDTDGLIRIAILDGKGDDDDKLKSLMNEREPTIQEFNSNTKKRFLKADKNRTKVLFACLGHSIRQKASKKILVYFFWINPLTEQNLSVPRAKALVIQYPRVI